MNTPDGLVGEPFSVDVSSDEPAVLLQINVELLEIVSGQFIHLNISQRRDDVLKDAPFVRHLCIRTEAGFLITLIPEIQPITQQDSGLGLNGCVGRDAVFQSVEFGHTL